jgi:hypothetical protein
VCIVFFIGIPQSDMVSSFLMSLIGFGFAESEASQRRGTAWRY